MKLLFSFVLWFVILVTPFICFAQDETNQPRLVEEFNLVNTGYAKMLIDNFVYSLNQVPQAIAYIIVYGASADCASVYNPKTKKREKKLVLPLKRLAEKRINYYHAQFEIIRKVAPSRLVFVDGGFRDKETTQFWLVSPGQYNPTPTPTFEEKNIKFRKGKLKPSDIVGDCPSSN